MLNSFLSALFKENEFNIIENYRYLRNNLIDNEVEASDANQSFNKDKIIGELDHFYNEESSILNAQGQLIYIFKTLTILLVIYNIIL